MNKILFALITALTISNVAKALDFGIYGPLGGVGVEIGEPEIEGVEIDEMEEDDGDED